LVQTKTHLVPGDKPTIFMRRIDRMVDLICQHVWQRDYDLRRKRKWMYGGEFAIDNRLVCFLVDHHGPDPDLIPDPPLVWYTWTGADLLVFHSPSLSLPVELLGLANSGFSDMVHDPLPRRVRPEVRAYPFVRLTAEPPPPPEPRRVRKFRSHEEEIRHRREDLRNTLACGLALFEEQVEFARQYPNHAKWVKARVPPDVWARTDDPS
jgi:hypothetical protein